MHLTIISPLRELPGNYHWNFNGEFHGNVGEMSENQQIGLRDTSHAVVNYKA